MKYKVNDKVWVSINYSYSYGCEPLSYDLGRTNDKTPYGYSYVGPGVICNTRSAFDGRELCVKLPIRIENSIEKKRNERLYKNFIKIMTDEIWVMEQEINEI